MLFMLGIHVSKLWYAQPIHTTIMEMLRRKGTLMDGELYKKLRRTHRELSLGELNRALMKLEVTGLIHVSYLTQNKKRVETRGSTPSRTRF